MSAVRAPKLQKRLPVYCPLSLAYDTERLYQELIALLPKFESLAIFGAALKKRTKWFEIADDRLYASIEHYAPDASGPAGSRVFVPGTVPSWWGISLTHVPDRPETSWGSNRYRRAHDGKWVWKDDLDIPYTRHLVESLCFERLDVVRVMSLPEGGFAPTHSDGENDQPWETEGFATISFLPRNGGVPMRFMASDGRLHDIDSPLFFFKDCVPHGIPQTTSRRLLLRVNGAAGPAHLRELMRLDDAIW